MQLQVILIVLLPFTEGIVKIDVSKLTSTTTVAQEAATVTVATTLATAQANVTEKSFIGAITSQLPPTTSTPTSTNTTINSTSNPESNQTEANVTRPVLDDHLPPTSRIKISPDHYYCSCDLMINLCDINCCCDNDCSDDMLSVFVCNEQHSSIYDFEYDAGLTSCEIKNELFCVVGAKWKGTNDVFDISLLNERTTYKWPEAFATDWSDGGNRESYKSGDSVLSFDEKAERIGMFGM